MAEDETTQAGAGAETVQQDAAGAAAADANADAQAVQQADAGAGTQAVQQGREPPGEDGGKPDGEAEAGAKAKAEPKPGGRKTDSQSKKLDAEVQRLRQENSDLRRQFTTAEQQAEITRWQAEEAELATLKREDPEAYIARRDQVDADRNQRRHNREAAVRSTAAAAAKAEGDLFTQVIGELGLDDATLGPLVTELAEAGKVARDGDQVYVPYATILPRAVQAVVESETAELRQQLATATERAEAAEAELQGAQINGGGRPPKGPGGAPGGISADDILSDPLAGGDAKREAFRQKHGIALEI